MMTHDCDLEKMIPDNKLIEDNQLLIYFNIFSCLNKCFKINSIIITLGKVSLYYFCHNIFDMFLFFNASYSFFGQ